MVETAPAARLRDWPRIPAHLVLSGPLLPVTHVPHVPHHARCTRPGAGTARPSGHCKALKPVWIEAAGELKVCGVEGVDVANARALMPLLGQVGARSAWGCGFLKWPGPPLLMPSFTGTAAGWLFVVVVVIGPSTGLVRGSWSAAASAAGAAAAAAAEAAAGAAAGAGAAAIAMP